MAQYERFRGTYSWSSVGDPELVPVGARGPANWKLDCAEEKKNIVPTEKRESNGAGPNATASNNKGGMPQYGQQGKTEELHSRASQASSIFSTNILSTMGVGGGLLLA